MHRSMKTEASAEKRIRAATAAVKGGRRAKDHRRAAQKVDEHPIHITASSAIY